MPEKGSGLLAHCSYAAERGPWKRNWGTGEKVEVRILPGPGCGWRSAVFPLAALEGGHQGSRPGGR